MVQDRRKCREHEDVLPVVADWERALGGQLQLVLALPEAVGRWLVEPRGLPCKASDRPTLTFWWDGARWRASMHDRLRMCVSYATGPSIAELMARLEEALEPDSGLWYAQRS